MRFFVVLGDGRKFGPADVPTLNQWIKENRLTPDSILEEELSGARQPALELRDLDFGSAPPPPSTPKPKSLAPNPFDPLSQMDQPSAPQPSSQAPKTESKYANPPSAVTNYPRGGAVPYTGEGVPPELQRGFNFGAFALTFIWGLSHRAYWVLIIIPLNILHNLSGEIFSPTWFLTAVLVYGFSVYCGLVGNRIAWNSGRFKTVDECQRCQRVWMVWGIIIFSLAVIFGFMIGISESMDL